MNKALNVLQIKVTANGDVRDGNWQVSAASPGVLRRGTSTYCKLRAVELTNADERLHASCRRSTWAMRTM